jgi:short-subunit dehydrogenase
MSTQSRPYAIVTGASAGIGFELARECAEHGYDLLIASDHAEIAAAAEQLRRAGTNVEALEEDLSDPAGVDKLYAATGGRRLDVLLANAGRGLGHAFLDQDSSEWINVVDTNITGTLLLIQKIGRDMQRVAAGRILITGSIAGFMPGTYQAVYNGTKAFLDSSSFAFCNEPKGSGVSVTCLMPGATATEFFERADMRIPRSASRRRTIRAWSPKQASTQ